MFTNKELAAAILLKLSERSQIDLRGDGTGAIESLSEMLERYAKRIRDEKPVAKTLEESLAPVSSEPAKEPAKGDMVRVVRGRKVPHGTEGVLFWMKEQAYDGKTVVRIGVKDSEGEAHWTYLKNVERIAA